MQQIQYDEGGYIVWANQNIVDAAANNVQGIVPSAFFNLGGWNYRDVWLDSERRARAADYAGRSELRRRGGPSHDPSAPRDPGGRAAVWRRHPLVRFALRRVAAGS